MHFSSTLPLPYFRIKLITLLNPGQMFPSRCNRGSERWYGITIRRNLEHTLCNRVNALTNDPLLNPDSDCAIIISSNSSGRGSNGFESSSTRFTSSTLPSSPLSSTWYMVEDSVGFATVENFESGFVPHCCHGFFVLKLLIFLWLFCSVYSTFT